MNFNAFIPMCGEKDLKNSNKLLVDEHITTGISRRKQAKFGLFCLIVKDVTDRCSTNLKQF